ncbi:hypothetical protein ISN34_07955 [Xanthomonas translucens pv. translucens]|uniref:Uncharacterized protein n=2 Tax=Xanthomonas campestris pv. translucens TaxID=343 RepID=A0A120EVZ8_XANCT|nr:hypothetical protein [Xanthomonas translucens]KWV12095.1 hypothetical protein ATB53_01380 [Xanthomonas translucens]QSQ35838.1 hypothetical protein ISN31_10165 [Xanthomonas translucens pv. translucens]QSQ46754.1 hypothetical protein ISN34_07955 [Xanthomonas translucens pv. translucens]
MHDSGSRPLTEAELTSLREEMRTAGHWMRARLLFAKLIRERLLGGTEHSPGHSKHREFADELSFLSLTLHSDSMAELRFGVRCRRERHTTGVLLSHWNDARFGSGAETRVCLHGAPCQLGELWEEFDRMHYANLPPIRPRAWRELY